MRRSLLCILIFTLILPSLSGCASKYGEQRTAVNYYPACYQPVKDLRDRENSVSKSTAGGAAIGALGGALLGFLASGGKWQGAVAGAVAGGATGAIAGNIYANKQKERDDNIRLSSYLQDIDGDISNLDVVAAAARVSLQCYDREFSALVNQIKSKAISKEIAQKRFAEISSGREEAIFILGDTAMQANNLNQEYEKAFIQEEQKIQQSPLTASKTQSQQQINTAKKRANELANRGNTYKKEQTDAQEASKRQSKDINELLTGYEQYRQDVKA